MITFEDSAFNEYRQWEKEDKNVYKKINALITEIMRDPFHGSGKPEPLMNKLSLPPASIITGHAGMPDTTFALCSHLRPIPHIV